MPRSTGAAGSATSQQGDPNALITVIASAATGALVLTLPDAIERVQADPGSFLVFAAVTLVLQLVSVEIYGRGTLSFAGTGLLALGFAFGPGAAMGTAALVGVVNLLHRRGRLNRGVFDAGQHTLAAGAGAGLYELLGATDWSALGRLGPAVAAGAAYMVVNVGLVCLAQSLAEGARYTAVWSERFRWFTPYYLASGPLALALTLAHERLGIAGLLAFALPPAMMMVSVRQYVSRTRQSVEEVRNANEELRVRNEDLRELFEFAGGLAARTHDRDELIAHVEESLSRLTGARAKVVSDSSAGSVELITGGRRVGALELQGDDDFDDERWARLRHAILPQLATAIESADLVDRVRRQYLATIAALSKSMEAKDYYTGGHTERVAEMAVAIAQRLGYTGADLHAIEIGALLHDIGKIGIPERILQKPGPLDEEEWKVMREHPIISEYILSEVDLPEIVLQISRSSHERMDGGGYPDGKRGDEIPLAARIVLVADAFDAMTSDRPYRGRRHVVAALDEVRTHAGTQFCPRVVAALERVYQEEPHLLGASLLRAVDVA